VPRRFLSLLAGLGTLLCVTGGLGVWYVQSRIDRARERAIERVDQAFANIDSRLIKSQELVAKSKITVAEVQQRLQDWTKQEAGDRLAERFDVESRLEHLAARLRQAEVMLDLSHETVEHVRQALEVGDELGLDLNADSVEPLLDRIAEIKDDLSRATATAASLGEQISGDPNDKSIGPRLEQAATIAARLLATFGKVDSRLTSFQGRLTDAQNSIRELSEKIHRRVVAAAFIATLFMLWMAAGQLCLWRWARSIGTG
jgi:hypothetical protein